MKQKIEEQKIKNKRRRERKKRRNENKDGMSKGLIVSGRATRTMAWAICQRKQVETLKSMNKILQKIDKLADNNGKRDGKGRAPHSVQLHYNSIRWCVLYALV